MLVYKLSLVLREFNETNNDTDLAMKPAAGLRPKKLTLLEVGPDSRCT